MLLLPLLHDIGKPDSQLNLLLLGELVHHVGIVLATVAFSNTRFLVVLFAHALTQACLARWEGSFGKGLFLLLRTFGGFGSFCSGSLRGVGLRISGSGAIGRHEVIFLDLSEKTLSIGGFTWLINNNTGLRNAG